MLELVASKKKYKYREVVKYYFKYYALQVFHVVYLFNLKLLNFLQNLNKNMVFLAKDLMMSSSSLRQPNESLSTQNWYKNASSLASGHHWIHVPNVSRTLNRSLRSAPYRGKYLWLTWLVPDPILHWMQASHNHYHTLYQMKIIPDHRLYKYTCLFRKTCCSYQ